MATKNEGPAAAGPRSPAERVAGRKPTPKTPKQQQEAATEPMMSSEVTPNFWAKYSHLTENQLGLGRNGKRLLHGGMAAGATFAAGEYAGVEIINNNMPAALGGAAVTGIAVTVVVDKMALDADQEAWIIKQRLLSERKEVQERYPAMAEQLMGELKKKAANG